MGCKTCRRHFLNPAWFASFFCSTDETFSQSVVSFFGLKFYPSSVLLLTLKWSRNSGHFKLRKPWLGDSRGRTCTCMAAKCKCVTAVVLCVSPLQMIEHRREQMWLFYVWHTKLLRIGFTGFNCDNRIQTIECKRLFHHCSLCIIKCAWCSNCNLAWLSSVWLIQIYRNLIKASIYWADSWNMRFWNMGCFLC